MQKEISKENKQSQDIECDCDSHQGSDGCGERAECEQQTDTEAPEASELYEAKERYLRLNAEFQNYKKRVEKEKADLIKYGNERLITDMLSIMDNIDRAVIASEDTQDTKLRDGIVLIKKSLDEVLKTNGLELIEAQDKEFNHDEHYAVMTEEVEGTGEGIVIDVLQKGYKLNGRVIRPSMVKVSK